MLWHLCRCVSPVRSGRWRWGGLSRGAARSLTVPRPCALQARAVSLYEACLALLQVYSRNSLGRQRLDVTAEEEQYQDLLLIMELLTNLLSKELIDFSDAGEGAVRA